MGWLGPLISAGSSLLGGLLSNDANEDMAKDQIKLQKQFAQNAIQWKVEDAKKAGVHPLYGLGANTVSYQPNMVGDSLGPALSDMGQDISRAVEAVQSGDERILSKKLTGLQLERAQLENDMLKAQIAGQIGTNVRNAQVGPAMPSMDRVQPPQRTPGFYFKGKFYEFDPGTSDLGQIGEDRAGEHLGALYGMPAVIADVEHQFKDMSFGDILKWVDDITRIDRYWK